MRQALALGTCLLAFAVAGTGAARPRQYLLPAQMRQAIEKHGFTVGNEHLLVRRAVCAGVREDGVRGAAFGGFSCRATAPDGSVYLLHTLAASASSFAVTDFGIESTADESVANCLDRSGSPRACIKQLSG